MKRNGWDGPEVVSNVKKYLMMVKLIGVISGCSKEPGPLCLSTENSVRGKVIDKK